MMPLCNHGSLQLQMICHFYPNLLFFSLDSFYDRRFSMYFFIYYFIYLLENKEKICEIKYIKFY